MEHISAHISARNVKSRPYKSVLELCWNWPRIVNSLHTQNVADFESKSSHPKMMMTIVNLFNSPDIRGKVHAMALSCVVN